MLQQARRKVPRLNRHSFGLHDPRVESPPCQVRYTRQSERAHTWHLGPTVTCYGVPDFPEEDVTARVEELRRAGTVHVGGKSLRVFDRIGGKVKASTAAALATAGQFLDLVALLRLRQSVPSNHLIGSLAACKTNAAEALVYFHRAGGDLTYWYDSGSDTSPSVGSHKNLAHVGGQHDSEPVAGVLFRTSNTRGLATVLLLKGARIMVMDQFGAKESLPSEVDQLVQLLASQAEHSSQAVSATKESKVQLVSLAVHAYIEILGSLDPVRLRMARHGAPATGCCKAFDLNMSNVTDMFVSACKGNNGALADLLLFCGARPDYRGWMVQDVPRYAARMGALEVLQVLVVRGYDVTRPQSCCQVACVPLCVFPCCWAVSALLSPYLLFQLCRSVGSPLGVAKSKGHTAVAAFLEDVSSEVDDGTSLEDRRAMVKRFNESQGTEINIDALAPVDRHVPHDK